jgi:hypothetical protein
MLAREDVIVGSAESHAADTDENFAGFGDRRRASAETQLVGLFADDRLHRSFPTGLRFRMALKYISICESQLTSMQ